MFWSTDGKPMSAAQFVERLFGELPQLFTSQDELRQLWSRPDTRKALLQSLAERGFGHEQLAAIGNMIDAEKSDVFDLLAYSPSRCRRSRARNGWRAGRARFSPATMPSCRPSSISFSANT